MADQVPDILLDLSKCSSNYPNGRLNSHGHHPALNEDQILNLSESIPKKVNVEDISRQLPIDLLISNIKPVQNIKDIKLDVINPITNLQSTKCKKTVKRLPPTAMKIPKIKPKHDTEQFDIPGALAQSISNDNSPFNTKYEDIIKEYTGKLKFCNEECSYSSFSKEDIDLQGEIGGGVSGTVYIVEHKPSKFKMAAKRMKWNPHLEEQKRILMDLKIMSIQKSEFIVFYYGSLVVKDNVWLYMELMDTCLDKILKKHGPLPEEIVGKITVATLNALHYLKSVHDIIHRDVKPSNILINKLGHIKICDFGISKQLVESCAATRGAGPTAYISPERLDIDLKEYDVRADVWSLGISVIELLSGKLPYSNCKSDIEVMTHIFQDPPPRLPDFMSVSKECRDFIDFCLTKDYTRRPKFQELLKLSEFVNIYKTREVAVATWFASLSYEK